MSMSLKLSSLVIKCLPPSIRNRLGEHLGRPNLRSALLRLKRYGFEPEYFVDGGANRGDWTRQILEIWPKASVLCVEPQTEPFASLESLAREYSGQVAVEQVLLGPESAEAIPFEENGTGASILLSSGADSTRPLRPLDDLSKQHFPRVDYLKLDLQGFEIEALKGFQTGLQNCQAVQLELSTMPLIPEAPLLHEVVAYMAEQGFLLWEVEELIRSPSDGAMWQMDAIFLRQDLPLRTARQWAD